MSFWQIMNYVAWAAAALIFIWLIKDFLRIDREYDENVLLGTYSDDAIDLSPDERGSA